MCDKAFFFQIGLAYTNLKDINKKLSHLRTAFFIVLINILYYLIAS